MNTESRNPRSFGLDKMTAREIIRLMDEEEMGVLRALKQVEAQVAEVSERVAGAISAGGRVVYVGAGTSGRIATMDAAEMPPTFGLEPDRFVAVISGGQDAQVAAKEDAEDNEHAAVVALNELGIGRQDVLIGLAASGETPFVVAAVVHARQKGVWTCGIANNRNSALTRKADLGIVLDTGPEVLTGSTRLKAGTAQKLVLNRISTTAMVLCGKVISNLMVDVRAKNQKLKERCCRIVQELTSSTFEEAWQILESVDWNVRAAVEQMNGVSVGPAR